MQRKEDIAQEESKQNNDVFIYKKMEPAHADRKLHARVALQEPEDETQTFWLLRESRQDGMLTVHRATHQKGSGTLCSEEPIRLAFTDKGWEHANVPTDAELVEIQKRMTHITSETASQYARQLENFLAKECGLLIVNRVNPTKDEMSVTNAYSCYNVQTTHLKFLSTPMIFRADIREAIICPFTKKSFRSPAVFIGDKRVIETPEGKINLLKGKSYEQIELEKLGLKVGEDFYLNWRLKSIVNHVGAQRDRLEKLKKIQDDEINCPITAEKFQNAVIAKSGHSYSNTADGIAGWINAKGDAATDPQTHQLITRAELVPNLNLEDFVNAWPAYFEKQQKELAAEVKPTTEKESEFRHVIN